MYLARFELVKFTSSGDGYTPYSLVEITRIISFSFSNRILLYLNYLYL
jgi:hypothetical protein